MRPPAREKSKAPRPRFVFAGLAAALVLAVMLTPEPTEVSGKGGMTSHSSALGGGQLLFDLARRLGWRVARREAPMIATPAPDVIEVLLAPSEPVTPEEAHLLLQGVRAGGGLLLVGDVRPFDDSLHVDAGERLGIIGDSEGATTSDCQRLFDEMPLTAQVTTVALAPDVVWTAPPPSAPVVLARFRQGETDVELDAMPSRILGVPVSRSIRDSMRARARREATSGPGRPAAVGFALGAGKVVFVPGSNLLTNQAIRNCKAGTDLLAVRALEYLSEGTPRRDVVVFDEYHHGYGPHASGFGAIRMFVASTSLGKTLAQVAVAGLLLLFAAGPRPIAPRDPARVARRSPLEQADALANAYEGVHGTRTVAARLVGGLRRRTGALHAGRTLDDEGFLSQVATAHPAVAADVAMVQRALHEPLDDKDLPALGAALQRVEAALSGPIIPATRTQ